MKLDKLVRKFVPSVSLLGHTKFALLVDVADSVIRNSKKEWKSLPPASLRMRIGGKIILFSHKFFIDSGTATIKDLSDRGFITPTSRLLEMGCGCGRNALALKGFLTGQGRYFGQDVDKSMIEWCSANLANEQFTFALADIYSEVYNPKGKSVNEYRFPIDQNAIDTVFSISVFSHLLADDFNFYLRECKRVLALNGTLHMTLFLMDFIRSQLGDRWTFKFKRENCYIENERYPEAAVAYDLDYVKQMLIANGFELVQIYNENLHQQTLIARSLGE